MTFYVYILICADGTYYTGCTNNLQRRLKQHNHNKSAAKYTKARRPVSLQYFESYQTLIEARRREAEIKSWKKKMKEQLWISKT